MGPLVKAPLVLVAAGSLLLLACGGAESTTESEVSADSTTTSALGEATADGGVVDEAAIRACLVTFATGLRTAGDDKEADKAAHEAFRTCMETAAPRPAKGDKARGPGKGKGKGADGDRPSKDGPDQGDDTDEATADGRPGKSGDRRPPPPPRGAEDDGPDGDGPDGDGPDGDGPDGGSRPPKGGPGHRGPKGPPPGAACFEDLVTCAKGTDAIDTCVDTHITCVKAAHAKAKARRDQAKEAADTAEN